MSLVELQNLLLFPETHNDYINSDLATIAYKLKQADIQSVPNQKFQKIFEFAPSATSMKLNTNYISYSIVIFTIVFDLTFTKTLIINTPFLIIFSTMKKPSSYLTMLILTSTDLQLLTYIHVWNIDKNLFFNYSLYFDLRLIT